MIQVHFFDAIARAPLGSTTVQAEALPDNFDEQTTINVGDQAYQVVAADPASRAEAEASGVLRIAVRPLSVVDPNELLFSLPTLCDFLPAIEPDSVKAGLDVVEMAEDDFRQFELVPSTQAEWAGEQLRAIQTVYVEHRADNGAFKQLHVRKDNAHGWLSESVVCDWLDEHLQPLDGVGYNGVVGIIDDGQAWTLCPGWAVYMAPSLHGGVHLGLHGSGDVTDEAMQVLTGLMTATEGAWIRWPWLGVADGSNAERLGQLLAM